jgi:hypothetical protein
MPWRFLMLSPMSNLRLYEMDAGTMRNGNSQWQHRNQQGICMLVLGQQTGNRVEKCPSQLNPNYLVNSSKA